MQMDAPTHTTALPNIWFLPYNAEDPGLVDGLGQWREWRSLALCIHPVAIVFKKAGSPAGRGVDKVYSFEGYNLQFNQNIISYLYTGLRPQRRSIELCIAFCVESNSTCLYSVAYQEPRASPK